MTNPASDTGGVGGASGTVEAGEVADLQTVLAALADPVRLEMVRRMFNRPEPTPCADLYDTVTKATASHHFKILREAGLVRRRSAGAGARYSLCGEAAEARYPGLLAAVLAAANSAA